MALKPIVGEIKSQDLNDNFSYINDKAQGIEDVENDLASHKADDVTDDVHGWDSTTRFIVGSFTRDSSFASGTQQITGLGFNPKAVIFLSTINSSAGYASWGIDMGNLRASIFDIHNSTSNSYFSNSSYSIDLVQSGGTGTYNGRINTLDNDGFTISWIKGDTYTGTGIIRIYYLAFR
ncbi:hypothetical protein SAMN05446037_100259 [Anaerovirgula multivorans]|uniref:Uncharacterized protein n=1 Tax=Anaerovirgula multivorans TaxID=312168 RepID=A0A239AI97_9FIRM|nr:hypothetical protein [Anaerovirgula multivorans]SNR95365.1 hypothetical protein SAMN05446037_100259 [Anaerovirgula multivorans]